MWADGKAAGFAIEVCARTSSICAAALSSTICTSWLARSSFLLSFKTPLDFLTDALGNLCYDQGKYEEARSLYVRVLCICEQALGPEHPDVAHILNNLADPSKELGHYQQGERFGQRALRIREQAVGDSISTWPIRSRHWRISIKIRGNIGKLTPAMNEPCTFS